MYFEQGGGQNDPKVPKKWYFSGSVEKSTIDMAQIFFGGDKEFYLATSDSKRFEPTWSQHTCRGGGQKKFSCRFEGFS